MIAHDWFFSTGPIHFFYISDHGLIRSKVDGACRLSGWAGATLVCSGNCHFYTRRDADTYSYAIKFASVSLCDNDNAFYVAQSLVAALHFSFIVILLELTSLLREESFEQVYNAFSLVTPGDRLRKILSYFKKSVRRYVLRNVNKIKHL